jgi:Fur family transcriptional regulator, ferric uptake regulator
LGGGAGGFWGHGPSDDSPAVLRIAIIFLVPAAVDKRGTQEARPHPERSEWGDATLDALHRKGLRNGGARRAVIELLAAQDCCLTAQEIFDELRASGRRVGIASVYRVLELLTSEGLVQRIDLGSGIARYEPVHSGGEHHHHLVCDTCGKVEAFEDPKLERALVGVEAASGYIVAGHDVVLHGACADCH